MSAFATNIDPFDSFKTAQKLGWAHFAPLAELTTPPAAQLVKHAHLRAGLRVLDVACGTGVVAVTAARQGARVTGLDLTPALLERARDNSRIAGVEVDWREGDVEKLPFEDSSFDVVLSQFGHIFAPVLMWPPPKCFASSSLPERLRFPPGRRNSLWAVCSR